ncbi:MAG: glycosyltransferase family 39 protein [Pyrinomonadaceae bacterium]
MAKKNKSKKAAAFQNDAAIVADETVDPHLTTTGVNEEPGTDYVWLGCSALITATAAFLRFFMLDLKPLHHDEGVNGFFLTTLFKDGLYKYDPANYHGPTLYYISLVFAKLFGLETIPVRSSMAIFGVLMVVLALFLKRYLGKVGTLIGALFLALSPGMVFISRYFIHEIFFVFLSLAIVVSILFFIEKRKAGYFAIGWMVLLLFVSFLPPVLNLAAFIGGENAGAVLAFRVAFFIAEAALVYFVIRILLSWDEGRPIYLLLASASAALFFATKETAFITIGTMLIACLAVWVWRGIRGSDLFAKNWFRLVLAVHAALIVAALYNRDSIADAGGWLYTTFLGGSRPAENMVFYTIIFLLVAAVAAWIMFLIDLRKSNESELAEPVEITWQNFRQGLGENTHMIVIVAAVATAFIYIGVLFFSSFFTYADGVKKAFEAYTIWSKTGSKDHTQNGISAYLKWGMKVESPIMILSALGAFIALLKGKHRVAMFTGLWALGLFTAYSIIPYKTPWLALSFLLPMCVIAGYGLGQLIESKNINLKVTAIGLTIISAILLTYQSYQHNFVRYDDEEETYVYAHTRRGFLDLMREVDRYADKSGKGRDATIDIVTPDYWPMTWYLHNYGHAYFHGSLVDASTSEMIIAKKTDQDAAMIQKYAAHYKYVGVYPLRPGVNLVLLVRNDLAESKDMEIFKVLEYKSIPNYTQ